MAWPPTVDELRQEITTQRSNESLHRILQDVVDTVSTYGLSDAISENKAMQLAVADVKFDALRLEMGADGAQVHKDHRAVRTALLIELGRLRRRAKRGLDSSAAPTVPDIPAAPTGVTPIRYLTFSEWETRAQSTTLPISATGGVNQARVESLLDDAAAWCTSVIPGNLMRGGIMLPTSDIPTALLAVCRQVSSDLVSMWLSPRSQKYMQDCAQCEAASSKRLMATAQAVNG